MFKKIKGDITKVEADVIINAADTQMVHGGGVAKAISEAAGEEFEKESKDLKFVPLGDFALTTAGNLKAKKVIHIPTIDYQDGGLKITYEQLSKVWNKVLEYCKKNGFKKITTPFLGAGVVGLDKNKVEEILYKDAQEFPELEVVLVEFT
jgi:O-acetyl-ADP-ribose deacetylase (regulator of RNase III)